MHGSFIDAKPDFWPYVGPKVATNPFFGSYDGSENTFFL